MSHPLVFDDFWASAVWRLQSFTYGTLGKISFWDDVIARISVMGRALTICKELSPFCKELSTSHHWSPSSSLHAEKDIKVWSLMQYLEFCHICSKLKLSNPMDLITQLFKGIRSFYGSPLDQLKMSFFAMGYLKNFKIKIYQILWSMMSS